MSEIKLNAVEIKYMVDRFLSWKLPDNFSPDAGVSFDPPVSWPWPTGTNLLDATQADAMVRYMVDGLPAESPAPTAAAATSQINREWEAQAARTISTSENGDLGQVARVPTSPAAAMREAAAKVAEGVPTTIGFRKWLHWQPSGRGSLDFHGNTYVSELALATAAAIRALPLPPDTRDGEIAELRRLIATMLDDIDRFQLL